MTLKKYFGRKKTQIFMCMSAIAVFITVLSFGSYRYFLDNKISQLAWTESEVLSRSASAFSREIGHIKRVTLLLRNSVNARLISQQAPASDQMASSDDWKVRVADEFSRFAQTSRLISQVRWIAPNGQELVRINAQDGVITRVSESQLQDKSDRGYVKNAPRVGDNTVYISSLDLNIENQEIVRPFQPTVRGVVRIDGNMPGILVVNYDLTKLFELMRSFSGDGVNLEILDANGFWMLSSNKSLEWGGILYLQDARFNIATHFPEIWQEINAIDGLERIFDDNRLWGLLKLHIDEEEVVKEGTKVPLLYFVAQSHAEVFALWQRTMLATIVAIASISFLIIAWLVWRQIVAQFETYRLLKLVQQEKEQAELANQQLRLTNSRLVDLQDELVETSKLSSLGLMVAGLAHEMHTPLGGVRMALSSCKIWLDKESDLLSKKAAEGMNNSLSIAEKNLLRALEVVSSFKRIVSDRTAQETQTFFFHNVVSDIMFTYKPVLKKRPEIKVHIDVPQNIKMLGFPGIMSQILQNLIDNALDHGFQRLDKGLITLTAKQDADNLVLMLKDNGRGISPEMKKRIFDPFATTGRTNKHTGLGLHLVSQWVNTLMRGRIDVETEVGVGTTFTLTVPLEQKITEEEN
ncbi:sensor histidine kinase [Marinomonas profundimaris]|uniref:sensor histidine kinase n=1 Tax=Marinomonas profundimaris TaxID=1208321 RepID=UPI0004CEEC74|nr:HAMP domain-containing sensor histidine kinase [Marinomonas profundimaris]